MLLELLEEDDGVLPNLVEVVLQPALVWCDLLEVDGMTESDLAGL